MRSRKRMKKTLSLLICLMLFFSFVPLNPAFSESSGANADLSGLTVASTVYAVYYDLHPAFDPAVTNYTVSIPNDVYDVGITAALADSGATLRIDGDPADSSVSHTVYGLVEDLIKTVPVQVTAGDGETVKTYNLQIKRLPASLPALPQTPADYAASIYGWFDDRVAIGEKHIAALNQDGAVALWGDNSYDQLNVPAGLNDVKALAAGQNFTLALREDGTVAAWGQYSISAQAGAFGPVTVPAAVQAEAVKLIAAGGNIAAVATASNGIIVWDGRSPDPIVVEPSTGLGDIVELQISSNYLVALNGAGNVNAWQINVMSRQLTSQTIPAELQGNVVSVTAGMMQWLALGKNGKVTLAGSVAPPQVDRYCQRIQDLENVRAMGTGFRLASALLADGSLRGTGSVYDLDGTSIGITNPNPPQELVPAGEGLTAISDPGDDGTGGHGSYLTVCGLRWDGALVVLGKDDDLRKTGIPAGLNLLASPGGNADLAGLAVSGGALDPVFDEDTLAYAVNVANNVTSVDITAALADSEATMFIDGAATAGGDAHTVANLQVGPNPVPVQVTAKEGAVKTYIITINRAGVTQSDNADLSGLTVSGGVLTPAFNEGTLAYTVNVANDVTSVNITATVADSQATLQVNGAAAVSGTPVTVANLPVGPNQVAVAVTAEDGTVQTYNITVNRAAAPPARAFTISDVKLLNPSNQEISSVAGKNGYRLRVQVAGSQAGQTNGLVIIQVRYGAGATAAGGGKVLNCAGSFSDSISSAGSDFDWNYELPEGLSGPAYIDAFVWDGWSKLAPMALPHQSRSFTLRN